MEEMKQLDENMTLKDYKYMKYVERDTPVKVGMRVNGVETTYAEGVTDSRSVYLYCRVCSKRQPTTKPVPNFCHHCGQRLEMPTKIVKGDTETYSNEEE